MSYWFSCRCSIGFYFFVFAINNTGLCLWWEGHGAEFRLEFRFSIFSSDFRNFSFSFHPLVHALINTISQDWLRNGKLLIKINNHFRLEEHLAWTINKLKFFSIFYIIFQKAALCVRQKRWIFHEHSQLSAPPSPCREIQKRACVCERETNGTSWFIIFCLIPFRISLLPLYITIILK